MKVPSDEESDASVSDHLTTIDRSTERKRKLVSYWTDLMLKWINQGRVVSFPPRPSMSARGQVSANTTSTSQVQYQSTTTIPTGIGIYPPNKLTYAVAFFLFGFFLTHFFTTWYDITSTSQIRHIVIIKLFSILSNAC
jgi:hypothetical protein